MRCLDVPNIGIITVYNSENCGSFLQAYALHRFLVENGYKAVFYKRGIRGTTHDAIRVLSDTFKLMCRCKYKLCACRIQSYLSFSRAQKLLPVISSLNNIDTVIIGSDTMWNFDDSYFWKMRSLYSGYDLYDKNTIAYAVSIANTKLETIKKDNLIVEGIKSLRCISVRDDATLAVVKEITKKIPEKVLDPTLIVDSRFYQDMEASIPSGDYLLIYCFDKLSDKKKSAILSFAKKMNLLVVSFGSFLGWEDVYEPLNPMRFLSYFNKSKYIITDTFHGNIFSIIYRKNFVSFGLYKNKVKSLLESVGLVDRICTDERIIEDILKNSPCYDEVYVKLEQLRIDSRNYLLNSLGDL